MSNVAGAGLPTNMKLTVALSDRSGPTEDAKRNRDIVAEAYLALERGEEHALVDILDPNIQFHEAASLPYGGSVQGVEATMKGVGGMMAAWRSIRIDIEEFTCAGDLVIAYMTFVGVSRSTGKTYSGPCAEVFRMANGRIVEWRPIYWDTKAAASAIGAYTYS